MQKRTSKKSDSAVSPVVGVMLMLVVTIVIAAVVATMAGGLVTNVEKTPSVAVSVDAGGASGSGWSKVPSTLSLTFQSVSEPISSSDLMISLSVQNKTGYHLAGSELFTASGKGIANLTDGSNEFGNFTVSAGTTISGTIGVANETVYDYDDVYNDSALYASAVIDNIAPDDDTHNTWKGLPDSAYPNYNKLGNFAGTPVNDAWHMVYLGDGWDLTHKNPWKLTQTTYDIDIVSGDKLGISIIYKPSGQTLFETSVVVS